ncbi:MAG: hypothetical protein ABI846_06140 [Rudaea sp.]
MSNRLSLRHVGLTAALIAILPALASAASLEPVTQAFHKLGQSRSHSETTITDDKGKVTHTSADFDTLDRIHTKTDHGEFIILPEGSWMKMGGNWSQPPIDMHAMVKAMMPMGEDMIRSAKNATDDGMTTWNGQPAHAYSYDTDTTIMGAHVSGHSKVYLSAAGAVIGSETDSVAMGKKAHSVQNVSYDDAIRVKAPM